MPKTDWLHIEKGRLSIAVRDGEPDVVTVYQIDHIDRDKWNTMIISVDDLRALVRAVDLYEAERR